MIVVVTWHLLIENKNLIIAWNYQCIKTIFESFISLISKMAMREIANNLYNCYNLSKLDNNSVIDWTSDPNSTEVLDIFLYPSHSLTYHQWNDTHYRWCGPMLYLLAYFSKFTNIKLSFNWNSRLISVIQDQIVA